MKNQYKLENLDCANCAAKMEAGIAKLPGVSSCTVNFFSQKLTVETENGVSDALYKDMKKVIHKLEPQVIIS